MVRGQGVAGGHGERGAGGRVDPVVVADEREMVGGRAQGQALGPVPVGVAGTAAAQLAIDGGRAQGAGAAVHLGPDGHQAGVQLVGLEGAQVPAEAAVVASLHVAGVRAGHGQSPEVGLLVLRGQDGRRKPFPVGARVGLGQSRLRVGIDGREPVLHAENTRYMATWNRTNRPLTRGASSTGTRSR